MPADFSKSSTEAPPFRFFLFFGAFFIFGAFYVSGTFLFLAPVYILGRFLFCFWGPFRMGKPFKSCFFRRLGAPFRCPFTSPPFCRLGRRSRAVAQPAFSAVLSVLFLKWGSVVSTAVVSTVLFTSFTSVCIFLKIHLFPPQIIFWAFRIKNLCFF